jgi:hypothetical protein
MLYPAGNLWSWLNESGPGFPIYSDIDQDNVANLNLFKVYDSIVGYQMKQNAYDATSRVQPDGRLNASRILLGTQVSGPLV